MANPYSDFINKTVTAISSVILPASYTDIQVIARKFHPAKLPDFTRYLIVVSPPDLESWSETPIAVRQFQYTMVAEIFMLVKNFDDVLSVLGDTAPNKGIYQLVSDVKDVLRASNLGGFLDKTYSEPAGPLTIEYSASTGFDSGEQALIRRARLRYVGRLASFCVPVTP